MHDKRIEVANPPKEKPLMLFDGDCGFCRLWIERWRRLTARRVDFESAQEAARRFPEVSTGEFETAVVFITPDGAAITGAKAVFTCLENAKWLGWLIRAYRRFPVFAKISEAIYRHVSRRRRVYSVFTRILWGRCLSPSTYRWSSWAFPKLLGALSLCAVVSYWIQAAGLVGSEGILPIAPYLERVGSAISESTEPQTSKWLLIPTVFWWGSSDFAINVVLAISAGASVALIVGVLPGPAALTLWVCYLSLLHAGRIFLTFQWDILLVEILFLAAFLGPWKLFDRLARNREPSSIVRLLLWFLFFRLMFESGMVKFQSYGMPGDINTWRDFTALDFHYWTQPLPAWTSWHFHHLPKGAHYLSLWITYAVELVAPFLFFAPRRFRNLAVAAQGLLQLAIMLSGNYGFFNLLALLLCVPLVDDQSLPTKLRTKLAAHAMITGPNRLARLLRYATALPVAIIVFSIGVFQIVRACEDNRKPRASETWLEQHPRFASTMRSIRPFLTVNSYGLFRVMTRTRPEIVISGSSNGLNWIEYPFKFKPGDPRRAPEFIIPHMPRLDWQMWFEGLRFERSSRFSPWFGRFIEEIAEGNPVVLHLLEGDPFKESPPKQMRVQLYHYTFSSQEQKRQTGHWWQRELLDSYTRQFRIDR